MEDRPAVEVVEEDLAGPEEPAEQVAEEREVVGEDLAEPVGPEERAEEEKVGREEGLAEERAAEVRVVVERAAAECPPIRISTILLMASRGPSCPLFRLQRPPISRS